MNVAKEAYQAIKAEGDPDFDGLGLDFKGELEHRAARAIATGIHQTPFETKVVELHRPEEAESGDDAPLAFSGLKEGTAEGESLPTEQFSDAEILAMSEEEAGNEHVILQWRNLQRDKGGPELTGHAYTESDALAQVGPAVNKEQE